MPIGTNCSYCGDPRHLRSGCPIVDSDHRVFKAATRLVREGLVALLAKHGITPESEVYLQGEKRWVVGPSNSVTLYSSWGDPAFLPNAIPSDCLNRVVVAGVARPVSVQTILEGGVSPSSKSSPCREGYADQHLNITRQAFLGLRRKSTRCSVFNEQYTAHWAVIAVRGAGTHD
jgi:hypothetical protein